MSIHKALEIREREAALRRTPLQKFAIAGPFIFFTMLLFGSASSLFSSHPERKIAELGFYVFCIFIGCIALLAFQAKSRRRIAVLEVEVLKLKRKLNESEEPNGA
jgi:hypothetical protein